MSARLVESVAAGGAWLDEHIPDWLGLVNLETLELGSKCRCVLGQLEEDYDMAKIRHKLDRSACIRFGFTAADDWDWPDLDDAWTAYIIERRQQREKQNEQH